MTDEFAADVTGISALAEPARRALYRYVVAQPAPVGREQAAADCELPMSSVKFHLDRLVDAGLLAVEFRRLTGRTGPGAGRPSKLYRRSDRQVSVSLPERRYDLAGQALAAGVESALHDGVPLPEAISEAAAALGRRFATDSGRTMTTSAQDEPDLSRAATVLAELGYQPQTSETDIRLTNCPFDTLARDHTDVVCGMNVSFVGGVLQGLGCQRLEAVLDPGPQVCCVRARRG